MDNILVVGEPVIPSKKPTLKSLAEKQLEKIEEYAIRSHTGRKIAAMFYKSDIYGYIIKQMNKFRDLKLIQTIKKDPVPEHIAIIMDGNRRFARELGLDLHAGHLFGRDKIEDVLEWCFELGIKNLTLYAFSTENFLRNAEEVKSIMELCKHELDRAKND